MKEKGHVYNNNKIHVLAALSKKVPTTSECSFVPYPEVQACVVPISSRPVSLAPSGVD